MRLLVVELKLKGQMQRERPEGYWWAICKLKSRGNKTMSGQQTRGQGEREGKDGSVMCGREASWWQTTDPVRMPLLWKPYLCVFALHKPKLSPTLIAQGTGTMGVRPMILRVLTVLWGRETCKATMAQATVSSKRHKRTRSCGDRGKSISVLARLGEDGYIWGIWNELCRSQRESTVCLYKKQGTALLGHDLNIPSKKKI